MKEAAGREATSFTYEFAHNNNLPGIRPDLTLPRILPQDKVSKSQI
jgi:hypothetical protein